MSSIRIVNLKIYKSNIPGEKLVRIDRTSVLGNPYKMADNSSQQRNYVCDLYQEYFDKIVNKEEEKRTNQEKMFMQELRRIYKLLKVGNNIALGCWCAPKRCHGETIKAFLEKYI